MASSGWSGPNMAEQKPFARKALPVTLVPCSNSTAFLVCPPTDTGRPRVRYDLWPLTHLTDWGFILWKLAKPVSHHAERETARANRSHRTLRGGSSLRIVPGNKLPGYDHLVPTGRSSSQTMGAPDGSGIYATKRCDRDVSLAESGHYHFVSPGHTVYPAQSFFHHSTLPREKP